ncbi:alpha/beta hydrolase family protein [Plantibacter sp. Mn2098]|uniref:alpha/beta hydrolase family protein n=1 Tax=Plantibacter sp. Mn2098 TaxID=3395266 RepID=UPI003BCED5A0
MPWIDIAAIVLMLATLVVGIATRRRRAVPVVIVGSTALVALLLAFVLEGARPQLLAAAIAAIAVAAVVLWTRSGRTPKLAVTGVVVLAFGLVGIAASAWALPPVFLPAPTGQNAVGVASHVWTDPTRDARGGSTAGQERSLPVTVWYPAAETGPQSSYLPNAAAASALTTALAKQYGAPPLLFDSLLRAKSNASWQSAPVQSSPAQSPAAQGTRPVVIASPGFASTRWFFTSWAEELASHGIIVIAVDHPYDAAATEPADGSIALDEAHTTGNDAQDQAAADRAVEIRAADVRAVIDHLASAPPTPDLTDADLTRIVAAGHSAGGATAIEAARLDPRIVGVVDIDGMPRSPAGTRLTQPLVVVVAGDMDPNPAYNAAVSDLLADENGASVTLDGVAHLGMMDVGRLIAPVPGVTGANGPDGARLAARATLALVTAAGTGEPVDVGALGQLGSVAPATR